MNTEVEHSYSKEKVLLKRISVFASLGMVLTYCVGFIYDAAYLEVFGVDHFEMVGSPLAYLSIGGIYLLAVVMENYKWVIMLSIIIGCGFGPVYRFVKPYLDIFIVKDDFTKVMLGLSPLLLSFIIPIIYDAQNEAKEIKTKNETDEICLDYQSECIEGHILRYRDSKIIFYSSDKELYVFTDRKLKKSTHVVLEKLKKNND